MTFTAHATDEPVGEKGERHEEHGVMETVVRIQRKREHLSCLPLLDIVLDLE